METRKKVLRFFKSALLYLLCVSLFGLIGYGVMWGVQCKIGEKSHLLERLSLGTYAWIGFVFGSIVYFWLYTSIKKAQEEPTAENADDSQSGSAAQ